LYKRGELTMNNIARFLALGLVIGGGIGIVLGGMLGNIPMGIVFGGGGGMVIGLAIGAVANHRTS
jgi:hypothetical protein